MMVMDMKDKFRMMMKYSMALALVMILLLPAAAYAACTDPVGTEGEVTFNNDYLVFQGCDGTDWKAFHDPHCPDGDGCLCDNSPAIGTTCGDGTIYAGLSPDGDVPMYTTPADQSSAAYWGADNFTAGATSDTEGRANTTDVYAHVMAGDGDANPDDGFTPNAFVLCEELDVYGHDDWYLPARRELSLLYNNLVDQDNDNTPGGPLGSTFGFNTSGNYWSSHEPPAGGGTLSRSIGFDDGTNYGTNKDDALNVRCVRKE